MKKERKKRRTKLALRFFLREKKWRLLTEVSLTSGHDSSVCRANSFAAQDESSKCRFPRSALQTSLYDVRITTKNFFWCGQTLPLASPSGALSATTKIGTTCTYYRGMLTVRVQRSSRTTEYYVLLNLRTIEKQKDWIWIGFQSGLPFFVHTIENYVL